MEVFLMPVDYQYRRGVDMPSWQWLSFFPAGPSYHGSSNVYDGSRFIYWVIQYSTTATTAGTTHLYRYDTWNNGWQYMAATTSGNRGIDIEHDPVRNVLVTHGTALTSWQVFNLNTTAVTYANVNCNPWTLTTMTPVLPVAADYGGSLTLPTDLDVAAQIDSGTADSTGNTTTVIKATDATGTFGAGMIGLQVRVTSGTQNNQRRTISAVSDKNTLTVAPALSGALASGDTFVVEPVEQTATSGTTSTVVQSAASWITNQYADHDVIIVSGTGAGQRRRIASNTGTTLTLNATVTGNARTGNFGTAPDATSVFRIVPSSDFLYYQAGNGNTAIYRIDVAQTTGAAWSGNLGAAPAGIGPGSNTFFPGAYAPGYIMALRGAATGTVYMFNIGTKAWTTLTTYTGSETFTTGANACMLHGKRKLFIQKEGQARCYILDLLTGILEPAGVMPYANPTAYDGKRARFIKTSDGVEWVYILRSGGQEYYRMPLEWV
jgi:hypothetical protein